MSGETSKPSLDATVLIATYNRSSLLAEAMEAILEQETAPGFEWELLVVDNNSGDDTARVVESYARRSAVPVRYVFEKQQGKSNALNTGLAHARGSIVVFTDDDVLVPKDWVATAQEVLERWTADVAGGRILPKWDAPPPIWLLKNPQLRGWLALMEAEAPQPVELPMRGPGRIWGANMVFRRSVLDQIGLFDVRLGPNGTRPVNFEDVDMVERALRGGRKAVYDPKLVVYHRIPSGRMQKSYFRRWAFVSGRAARLRGAAPSSRFQVFGRPVWLYLRTARALAHWLVAKCIRRSSALDLELEWLTLAGVFWWYREGV